MLATVVAALSLGSAFAAECHGKPGPNPVLNEHPIYTAAPTFVKSVPNGKLYTVGGDGFEVPIVHLWGSPYERGYAQGQLMKESATKMMTEVYEFIRFGLLIQPNSLTESMIAMLEGPFGSDDEPQSFSGKAPAGLETFLEAGGVAMALDMTSNVTAPFTGAWFDEELHGLADAMDFDFQTLRRIHMIGEITKGSCSMYGAWGASLPEENSDGLLQLRALDWNMQGPFHNYPQITVYHSENATEGNSFLSLGWTGFIGSITGVSEKQMGISEIGVSFPDATFGKESRYGVPFTYILRDILQWDSTLQEAETRLTTSNRTCNLILGVGDGKIQEFRGVEYSASIAKFMDDTNQEPVEAWHPRIPDVAYWGMDWLCPAYNQALSEQISKFHGNMTAENTIHYILPTVQTGDTHAAVYDLTSMDFYFSTAARDGVSGPAQAYNRPFTKLDLDVLFGVAPPASDRDIMRQD